MNIKFVSLSRCTVLDLVTKHHRHNVDYNEVVILKGYLKYQ